MGPHCWQHSHKCNNTRADASDVDNEACEKKSSAPFWLAGVHDCLPVWLAEQGNRWQQLKKRGQPQHDSPLTVRGHMAGAQHDCNDHHAEAQLHLQPKHLVAIMTALYIELQAYSERNSSKELHRC